MIHFQSGGSLCEGPSDLPEIPQRIHKLYADFETSSGDPSQTSLDPHWPGGCTVIGAGVAIEDGPVTFVPRRLLLCHDWWGRALSAVKDGHGLWINHNVKYDMHVSTNDLGVRPDCGVECTLNTAKMIDSDRGFVPGGYGLDALSRDWHKRDISEFYLRMAPYIGPRQKDYGRIPLDLLAEYACVDAEETRWLHKHEVAKLPDECLDVWRTEQRVTALLFEMEQRGVCIDPIQVKVKQGMVLLRMLELELELERIAKRSFRPHVNEDVHDVLCCQFGLPVLKYTTIEDEDEPSGERIGGPSFDKGALSMYKNHPDAPEGLVDRIEEYRKLNTFNNLFLRNWDSMNVKGVLHSTYNQSVRTGRMSCSKPNLTQLSEWAKELIIPPEGYGIVSADLSQIEFRMIVHYLENKRCIDAYNRNPWTDFHVWVAKSVPTKRKAAKTINFMLGYGAGKKRTCAVLAVNKDLVGEIVRKVDADDSIPEGHKQEAKARLCEQRALGVYAGYHSLLPELKPVTKQACAIAERRGYVRNHYGRHLKLTSDAAWMAFSTVGQSSSADLFKERIAALRDEVPEFLQVAVVHDQVVGLLPLETLRAEAWHGAATLRRIVDVMNSPTRPLRVPLRTSIGWSDKNWAEAQSEIFEQRF